jgi:hypothetical protein
LEPFLNCWLCTTIHSSILGTKMRRSTILRQEIGIGIAEEAVKTESRGSHFRSSYRYQFLSCLGVKICWLYSRFSMRQDHYAFILNYVIASWVEPRLHNNLSWAQYLVCQSPFFSLHWFTFTHRQAEALITSRPRLLTKKASSISYSFSTNINRHGSCAYPSLT